MSRRRVAKKRSIIPDCIYGSVDISKFTNMLMKNGAKSIAERIVYDALKGAAGEANVEVMELFDKVLINVGPSVEVRSRRLGGATYQIPMEVSKQRSKTMGMRFLILAARSRSEKTMKLRLAAELYDAYYAKGAAFRNKEEKHKVAEANRAFANFRW